MRVLGCFGTRPSVLFHFRCPLEKPPEIAPFAPDEPPEFQEMDLLHLDPAVGLHPPKKIRATPGRQPVPAGSVPKKADHVTHELVESIAAVAPRASNTRRKVAVRIPFGFADDIVVPICPIQAAAPRVIGT